MHNKLKDFLKQNNIKQIQVAHNLGMKQATVNHYLNGRRHITTAFLNRFCAAFNIEPNTFFSNKPLKNPDSSKLEVQKQLCLIEKQLNRVTQELLEIQKNMCNLSVAISSYRKE